MYGTSSSGVPLGPIVPTAADSSTVAPVRSASEPRCVSETVYPSPVRMLRVSPFPGVVPENETTPPDGATTAPPDPPMSMPRRWPAA